MVVAVYVGVVLSHARGVYIGEGAIGGGVSDAGVERGCGEGIGGAGRVDVIPKEGGY